MPEATEEAAAVVEEVRTDGAAVVAGETAGAVAAGAAVVTEAVEGVREELEDHAALSEERHDQILEGEAWLRNQIEMQGAALAALTALVTALQSTFQAGLSEIRTELVSLRGSLASRSQSPTAEEPPQIPVSDPVAAAKAEEAAKEKELAAPSSQETPPTEPQRRKRPRL